MFKFLMRNTFLLLSIASIVVLVSLSKDIGNISFEWFQRSGSFLVLIGGLLSYRSIVRLGVSGVGSPTQPTFTKGTVVDTYEEDDRQMVSIKHDDETIAFMTEAQKDSIAGYLGALLIIIGTIIWGYGDLFGVLF